jgi:hypothetical protein
MILGQHPPAWLDRRTRFVLALLTFVFFWLGIVSGEAGRGVGWVLMIADAAIAILVIWHAKRRLRKRARISN